jgi:hypothetical protein
MSYLRYLCLLAPSGVQHILYRVVYHMVLMLSGLSILDCPFGIL